MKATSSVAILLTATISACGGYSGTNPTPGGQDTPPPPGATEVTIQDFSFVPQAVTIKVGTAVHWTNRGPSGHTTTSDAGMWDSGLLAVSGTGGSGGGGGGGGGYGVSTTATTFTFTFTQPGTYAYHCSTHPPSAYPSFTGTVTVTP